MSKIHLALEKAERERADELRKKSSLSVTKEELPGPGPGPSAPVVALDKLEIDRSLVSLFQPHSIVSEQFRKLRTHLLRLNLARPVKTIMVTSAVEGEGKSFVAANLAIGVAYDLHLYSLLVDCDLRNPSVGGLFGRQGSRGMADYLTGKGDISEYLVRTEMDKLSIIPAGSIPQNPTEIIGSQRMSALVEELKSRYQDRFIIFEFHPPAGHLRTGGLGQTGGRHHLGSSGREDPPGDRPAGHLHVGKRQDPRLGPERCGI